MAWEVGLEHLRERLLCRSESAGQARELLRRLPTPLSKADQFTTALVLTELVSNAIRHGCGDPAAHITVSIARAPGTVRIEVGQPGPLYDPDALRLRQPGADGGWGVLIVERMTRDWGLDPATRTAWAEVSVDSGSEEG